MTLLRLYLKELPNLIECSIVLALIYVWNAKIADIFELLFYSHTCIKRSSLGQRKGGLKTGDLLKEVKFI